MRINLSEIIMTDIYIYININIIKFLIKLG